MPRTPKPAFNDPDAILEFEAAHPNPNGIKTAAISATFNVHPACYQQRLAQIIRTADAVAADPALVKRARRLEDEGQARRNARYQTMVEVRR